MTAVAGPGVATLAAPEPDLTPGMIIGRARALRERLRDEQEATEARTYHSAELNDEFTRAGFYRMLQPRRFGGYEFTLPTFFRTIIELSRGCPGTGWCVGLSSSHVLTLAMAFDAETQAAAFGSSGHFVAPSRPVPTGTALPTSNGWLVNGQWDYCSGLPYSTHVLNMVMLPPGADGLPTMGLALVPRADVTMLADWGDVIGLRGSGSHTAVVSNAEVPRGFVSEVNMLTLDPSLFVGYEIHGNSMYAGLLGAFVGAEIVACAIGIARAGLDEYAALSRMKTIMFPPFTLRSEDPQHQQWFGRAQTLVDGAEAMLLRVGDLYHEFAEASVTGGEPFTPAKDARLASMTNHAGGLAVDAMDILVRTGGSSALRNGARMQRYWRDISTFRAHLLSSLRENGYTRSGAAYLAGGGAAPVIFRPSATA